MVNMRKIFPKNTKAILASFVPIYLQITLEPMLGTVNNGIIGRLGTSAVAGLTVSNTILNIASGIFWFLSIICTTASAKKFGAGDAKGATENTINLLYLAIGFGIIVTSIVYVLLPHLTRWFGASESVVYENSISYSQMAVGGITMTLILFVLNGYFRSADRLKLVTTLVAMTVLIDVILCYTFVHIFGWGMHGAGLGKLLSMIISGIITFLFFARAVKKFNASFWVLKITSLGVKYSHMALLSARSITLTLAYALLPARLAVYGEVALASMQIVDNYYVIGIFAFDALATVAQIDIARAIGSGNIARVKQTANEVLRIGMLMAIPFTIVELFLGFVATPFIINDSRVVFCVLVGVFELLLTGPMLAYLFTVDGFFFASSNYGFLGRISILAFIISSAIITIPIFLIKDVYLGIFVGFLTFDLSLFGTRTIGAILKKRNDNWIGLQGS